MSSSSCFKPEGSSSGRQLYIQIWYSVFYMHQYNSLLGRSVCVSNTLFCLQDCL